LKPFEQHLPESKQIARRSPIVMSSMPGGVMMLVGALMAAAACASEVTTHDTLPPDSSSDEALVFGDDDESACPLAGEAADCALSLRQLRARQLDEASATEDGEGVRGVEEALVNGGQGADDEAQAPVAYGPHSRRPIYHANSAPESQLRWTHDRKFCMSADGNAFKNGNKMQLWTCAGGMGQYFNYNPNAETTLLRSSAAPAFCVVIDGDQNFNGAKVQLWACNPQDKAQRWTLDRDGFQNALIRSAAYPSKCLVVNLNSGWDGNKLQIWDCHGNSQFKQWTLTHQ